MSWQWNWWRGQGYRWGSGSGGGKLSGAGGGVPWLFYAMFIGVGLIFLAVGVGFTLNTCSFQRQASVATGQVVRYESHRDDEGTLLYYPVVQFTTAEGSAIEFTGDTGSSFRGLPAGSRVKVYYRPDDPQGARLGNFGDMWLLPVLFLGFGLVFPAVGVAVWAVTSGSRRATGG